METEQQDRETLKRKRLVAAVFGIIVVLATISLGYAFVQKGIADEARILAEQKSIELTKCAEEARRAQQMAEAAMEQARQAQQRAEAHYKKH